MLKVRFPTRVAAGFRDGDGRTELESGAAAGFGGIEALGNVVGGLLLEVKLHLGVEMLVVGGAAFAAAAEEVADAAADGHGV